MAYMMNERADNMYWLHYLTNGKLLVSDKVLTEAYSEELKECKRELVKMEVVQELKLCNECKAIDAEGKCHGTFYIIK